ncbi:hypothetical protein HPB49_003530 [Dermacentor silvarum]|uniref:Uncharacterized protein n=1 Tax=Dermacentor silvarum TaxID=543639 RepID=A0ACB8DTZ7_DERSI|nr:hypothetical protein HPB49_003530 [Dermacentor silvarum]
MSLPHCCRSPLSLSTKPGYVEYSGWREHWSRNARLKASLRLFMADQVLPFWAQCVRCRKWRCLPKRDDLTPEFVDTFTCSYIPSYDNTSVGALAYSESLMIANPFITIDKSTVQPDYLEPLLH